MNLLLRLQAERDTSLVLEVRACVFEGMFVYWVTEQCLVSDSSTVTEEAYTCFPCFLDFVLL